MLGLLPILLHLLSFSSNIFTLDSDSPLLRLKCLLEQFKVSVELILVGRDTPILSDFVFVLDASPIEFVTLLGQLH